MPIQTSKNTIYVINDLEFQKDSMGYYLSMNLGHCDAAVLCISHRGPIEKKDLELSERELGFLLRGSRIERDRYTLQGITRQAMAGSTRYRAFEVSPPAFVQVWGMRDRDMDIYMYVPDDSRQQSAPVPQLFSVEIEGNQMYVRIDKVDGYHDGDLMYQVADHLPIPIPACGLNTNITVMAGSELKVFAADYVKESYKMI